MGNKQIKIEIGLTFSADHWERLKREAASNGKALIDFSLTKAQLEAYEAQAEQSNEISKAMIGQLMEMQASIREGRLASMASKQSKRRRPS